MTKVARPLAVRYYLTAAHYRSTIEYHEGRFARPRSPSSGSRASCERVAAGVARCAVRPATIPREFAEAMDDDLNVSGALAVVHETVRAGNAALDVHDHDAGGRARPRRSSP